MIDLTQQVRQALEEKGLTPFYAYPQAWETVPVVAFWESGNTENEHADDAELTSRIEYNLDIWAETPEEAHAISHTANAAMQGLGFIRMGCYDLFEGEIGTQLYHRNMTYQMTTKNIMEVTNNA